MSDNKKVEPDLVRINIRLSNELKTWYENKAREDGIPYSALMVFALKEYRKQDEALHFGKSAIDLKDLLGAIPNKKL